MSRYFSHHICLFQTTYLFAANWCFACMYVGKGVACPGNRLTESYMLICGCWSSDEQLVLLMVEPSLQPSSCFSFKDTDSFCRSSWPKTHYVAQAGSHFQRSFNFCLLSAETIDCYQLYPDFLKLFFELLLNCVCLCWVQVPWEKPLEELLVTVSWLSGCWELNSGPLQQQYVHLTTETLLQILPLYLLFLDRVSGPQVDPELTT